MKIDEEKGSHILKNNKIRNTGSKLGTNFRNTRGKLRTNFLDPGLFLDSNFEIIFSFIWYILTRRVKVKISNIVLDYESLFLYI